MARRLIIVLGYVMYSMCGLLFLFVTLVRHNYEANTVLIMGCCTLIFIVFMLKVSEQSDDENEK